MNSTNEGSDEFRTLDLFCDLAVGVGQATGSSSYVRKSSSKRKHNTLSLETKLEIIQRLENKESGSDLADYYNVGRATIFDIRRKRQKIRKFASQLGSAKNLKARKTMRGGKKLLALLNKTKNAAKPSPALTKEGRTVPERSSSNIEECIDDIDSPSAEIPQQKSESETSSSSKRKHNVLSLEDKIEVITRLENGETIASLAKYYNIGRATVFDIKNKKESILSFASQLQAGDGARRRKTMRKANDEALEEAVFLWYKERHGNGQSVTSVLLTEKALELNKMLGGPEDFKASSGWLKNFKTRRGITKFSAKPPPPAEEKTFDDYSFLEAYLNLLQQDGYNRDDIYTTDKMELNIKTMPRKSFLFQHESENTRKTLENVMIMMCANSSWTHSLPLLMIGKSKIEKCFRKVSCLPILYRSQADGTMDEEIFLEWYANEFISSVMKERNNTGKSGRVLLLLHNAPYLPSIDALNVIDENFQVLFFPQNMSSFVHSMDQSVLKKLRTMFKIQVLNRLLMTAGNEKNVVELSKRLTLKDFSYMLADTWSSLAEEKMKEVCKRLWGMEEESEKNEPRTSEREVKEVVEMCKTIPNLTKCDVEDIRTWLSDDNSRDFQKQTENADNDVEVITPLPIGETARGLLEGDEDDPTEDEPQVIPTHHEAIKYFETAIEWCERQKECFPEQLILLKRLKDMAANKSLTN